MIEDELRVHLAKSFPLSEEFTDCCGRTRTFVFTVRDLQYSFVVEAREQCDHTHGYEFEVHSESNPFEGLGELRVAIRKALSRRFLAKDSQGVRRLLHNELEGRISNDGLVIHGELFSWAELKGELVVHEGFEIHIEIS